MPAPAHWSRSPKSWPLNRPPGRSEATIRCPERREGRRGAEREREARVDEVAVGPLHLLEAGDARLEARLRRPRRARRGGRAPPARGRLRARASRGAGARRCRVRFRRRGRRRGRARRSARAPRRRVGRGSSPAGAQVAPPGLPGLREHAQPVAVGDLRERLVVEAACRQCLEERAAARRPRRARRGPRRPRSPSRNRRGRRRSARRCSRRGGRSRSSGVAVSSRPSARRKPQAKLTPTMPTRRADRVELAVGQVSRRGAEGVRVRVASRRAAPG